MLSMMKEERKWFLKNSFCDNVFFGMLFMMEEERKKRFLEKCILLSDYFLYVAYDGARKKISLQKLCLL